MFMFTLNFVCLRSVLKRPERLRKRFEKRPENHPELTFWSDVSVSIVIGKQTQGNVRLGWSPYTAAESRQQSP